MTEKFIKKQIYECAKCGKEFTTKDAFNEHYEREHAKVEIYQGKILEGEIEGVKVFASVQGMRGDRYIVDIITPGYRGQIARFLWPVTYTDPIMCHTLILTESEIKDNFVAVEPEIVADEIKMTLYQKFIKDLKKSPKAAISFKPIFDNTEREKNDGN